VCKLAEKPPQKQKTRKISAKIGPACGKASAKARNFNDFSAKNYFTRKN